ncbi:MAG: hypothetical protein ACOCWC_05460 [Bacteroidota bacterium]
MKLFNAKIKWPSSFLLAAIIILFTIQPLNTFAFDEIDDDVKNMPIKERFFFGLSAGVSFSSIETSVVLSPTVGFRFTNRIMAGVGGTYQYYNDRSFGRVFSTHIWGYSVFSRFLIIPQIFIHGEFESLNMMSREQDAIDAQRIWENNYFLGPGYRLKIGRNAYFNILILYNFNQNSRIYFQNPIFRFNIEFGL